MTEPVKMLTEPNVWRNCMAEREQKTWRELCDVARKSNDPYELLRILRELNKALKREG